MLAKVSWSEYKISLQWAVDVFAWYHVFVSMTKMLNSI